MPCHSKGFHSESPVSDREMPVATVVQSESSAPFYSGFQRLHFPSCDCSDEAEAFIKNTVPQKQYS